MATIQVEWREAPGATWRVFDCEDELDEVEYVEWILRDCLACDPGVWNDYDGQIEIRSPERLAGLYDVDIDWEPRITATRIEAGNG
jgi:hypothetical protein